MTSTNLLKKRVFASSIGQIRRLNLQEYQSKQLLRSNGCVVQNFFTIDRATMSNLDAMFNKHEYAEYVVKAQILAGARGKGHFLGANTNQRRQSGVFITKSSKEAKDSVGMMIGKRLVTKQTPEQGVLVNRVMFAESVQIRRETYLSVLMDPTQGGPVIVACPLGGADIEEIARKQPELILKEPIAIEDGVSDKQCRRIADFLQFTGHLTEVAIQQIRRLYDLFLRVDAVQVEINPFAETEDGQIYCIDAKLNFDDNAAFRQSAIFGMDTFEEMDVREVRAKKCGLNYIGLDGNIACMVNGAGLAMATMDIIKLHGGEPANFLDVGGGATVEQVREAFKIITAQPAGSQQPVRVIFVNIFGGIMRCDTIAEGVIGACRELGLALPVVLRLKGTRYEQAKQLLATASSQPGFHFQLVESFEEAAKRTVQLAGKEEEKQKEMKQQGGEAA